MARAARCRGCGRFFAAGRTHGHQGSKGRADKERSAARLVRKGVSATAARRRAGLGPLPQYLTYRPRGRLARHLAADQARRTQGRLARIVPPRPRRWSL